MAFEFTWIDPYYTGSATSSAVPGTYPVAIAGHPYMIDTAAALQDQFTQESVPYIVRYAFYTGSLGEDTLNPDPAWRESVRSWQDGAGQIHYDTLTSTNVGVQSDPFMFRASKGIDPWTPGQFSALQDTQLAYASANTNLDLAIAGTYLYVADGSEVYWSLDGATFTAAGIAAGNPAQPVNDICSDGLTVYAALGTGGINTTTRGQTSSSTYVTSGDITNVAYVKGRLMCADNASAIYNIVATGALPTALFKHPNADFQWIGFADGESAIYAAGFSGDKSEIYAITIQSTGVALAAPTIAAALPSGEVVTAISAYLGFVVVGTTKGVRFCTETSSGLTVGALIQTNQPCRCAEGQERFIWFGWDNYDTESTGLGRMDLTQINPGNVPAYASDLMASAQGQVTATVTFGGQRYMAVNGTGVFAESANLVNSGYIDSGLMTVKLQDGKVPLEVDVRRVLTAGTHQVWLAVDGGPMVELGQHDKTTASPIYQVGSARGQTIEVRHVLGRDAVDPTAGPVVYESTLFALPVPPPGDAFTVPIRLEEEDRTSAGGALYAKSVANEWRFLRGLRNTQTPVIYQEGEDTYRVVVSAVKQLKRKPLEQNLAWAGTVLVTMKTINTPNGSV